MKADCRAARAKMTGKERFVPGLDIDPDPDFGPDIVDFAQDREADLDPGAKTSWLLIVRKLPCFRGCSRAKKREAGARFYACAIFSFPDDRLGATTGPIARSPTSYNC